MQLEVELQHAVQALMTGAAGVLGWFIRVLWNTQRELHGETVALAQKVTGIELLVAGQYVRRDELKQIMDRIDHKLDAISTKLDSKADK